MVRVWSVSCPWSCDASESASHARHVAEPPGVHRSPSAGGGLRLRSSSRLEPESIGHCWVRQDGPHLRLGSGPGAWGETLGEVPVRNSKKKNLLKHQELKGVGLCHFHRYSSCHLDWSNGVASLWLWFQTFFNVFLLALGSVFHFCAFGAPPVDWCGFCGFSWRLLCDCIGHVRDCQRTDAVSRVSRLVPFVNLQDFVVLKTIHDDCRVLSLAWNAHLLGVGGRDKKVWVYDSSKDGARHAEVALGTHFFVAGKLGVSEFGVCSKVCLGCNLFDVWVWSSCSFLALRLARMVIFEFCPFAKVSNVFLSTYIFPKAVFDMIFRYFPDKWLLVKCFFDNKPDKPPLIWIHIDMIVNSILVYATGSPMSPSNTIRIIPNIEFSWVHASNLLGQNIVQKIGIAEAAFKSTPIPPYRVLFIWSLLFATISDCRIWAYALPCKKVESPSRFSLMAASVRTFSWWEKMYIACKLCVVIQGGLRIWLSFAAFSVSLCRFWISTESTGHVKDLSVCRASQEFALLKIIDDASDEINCVSWGQQLLAAAGDDKTVRIYDVTKEPRPGAGPWSHNVHNIQIGE